MTLWSSHHSISDDATEPSPLWCSGWGKMKRRFMSQDISIAINLCLEFWCPGMLKRRSGQDCCEDVFQIAFPSDRQCAALVPLPQSDNCLWDEKCSDGRWRLEFWIPRALFSQEHRRDEDSSGDFFSDCCGPFQLPLLFKLILINRRCDDKRNFMQMMLCRWKWLSKSEHLQVN